MGGDDQTPRHRRPGSRANDNSRRRSVPEYRDGDEPTEPFDVLDLGRPTRATVIEATERTSRDAGDLMTVADGLRILDWSKRRIDESLARAIQRSDESAQRATLAAIDEVRELVSHPPSEAWDRLQTDIAALQKQVNTTQPRIDSLWSVRNWIAGVLAGLVLGVGYFLWDASSKWTKLHADLSSVQRDTEENRQDLRNLRRNKGTEP